MSNRTIQRIVILGAFAIVFVIASLTYWVSQAYSLKEKDFDTSVNIALLNTARELSAVNRSILPTRKIISRLSSNTYAVNINSQISALNLDFYLRKWLEQTLVNEDFDYAIYDCHDEKMVYGKYVSYSHSRDSLNITRDFPKLADATYYFVVRFPQRTTSVWASMSLTLVFTGISILTVIFFIYALSIILRQKRLSELQKDFINNMTHEFKTPISTIKIAADVFAMHDNITSNSRLARYAQIIREQNERLNTQVEKVLQLTRIDKKTLELSPENIDLHELLATIVPSVQMKIEGLNGRLDLDFRAKKPFIEADRLHLTNILHNLLDNAIKYSKPSGPLVKMTTEDLGSLVRLTIADAGIGIEKEHQKKVFHRFYRVPTGNVHNVKGFGLGLYYVKNIVSAHHWRLDLQSEINKGTRLTIDIPRTKGANTAPARPATAAQTTLNP